MTEPADTARKRRRHPRIAAVAALVLVGCSVLVVSRATADGNWKQTWKDRVRVETPLGASKGYAMAWIDQNVELLPFATPEQCVDSLQDVPIVELAGIDEDASSYACEQCGGRTLRRAKRTT